MLDDREAMLALVRKAIADKGYGGGGDLAYGPCSRTNVADALGDADLAAALLRKGLESQKEFRDGSMAYNKYFQLWISPYSSLRAHPGFKQLLIETGLADYWRQTGKWGDACKPVGADDFQCR